MRSRIALVAGLLGAAVWTFDMPGPSRAATGTSVSGALTRASIHPQGAVARRFFRVSGKYVHAISLNSRLIAWVSESEPRGKAVLDRLYVSPVSAFRPRRLSTAQDATIASVQLSETWVAWESQSYSMGYGIPRSKTNSGLIRRQSGRRQTVRKACGGGMPAEPWAIYAQNLQTGQRVLVDSSLREEDGVAGPDGIGGLAISGDSVYWVSVRCDAVNRYHVCVRKLTELKLMHLPGGHAHVLARGSVTTLRSRHSCGVSLTSTNVSPVTWLANVGASCLHQPRIAEMEAASTVHRLSGMDSAVAAAQLAGVAWNGRYMAVDRITAVFPGPGIVTSALTLKDMTTGRRITVAKGGDPGIMCANILTGSPCGHTAQMSSSLLVWSGGVRHEKLWTFSLQGHRWYRLSVSRSSMLEPWMVATWGHRVAWPVYLGAAHHKAPYIELANIHSSR